MKLEITAKGFEDLMNAMKTLCLDAGMQLTSMNAGGTVGTTIEYTCNSSLGGLRPIMVQGLSSGVSVPARFFVKQEVGKTTKMVEISLGHITEETAQELTKWESQKFGGEEESPFRGLFYTPWGDHGFIFNPCVFEDERKRLQESHPDLIAVLDYANRLGAYRLQLDQDAGYVEELQSFDW